MREYLQELNDQELLQLELEVLNSTTNPDENMYLKAINEEKEYRNFKKIYNELKLGIRKDNSSFINSNPVDLLAIYRNYKEGNLFNYLEGKTIDELQELEQTLIKKYKFDKNDPIVVEVRERYKYLDFFSNYKKDINTDVLVESYYNESLNDYLKTLTDIELECIYKKLILEIMDNTDDLDLEKISVLDEIIYEKEERSSKTEGKLR